MRWPRNVHHSSLTRSIVKRADVKCDRFSSASSNKVTCATTHHVQRVPTSQCALKPAVVLRFGASCCYCAIQLCLAIQCQRESGDCASQSVSEIWRQAIFLNCRKLGASAVEPLRIEAHVCWCLVVFACARFHPLSRLCLPSTLSTFY
jgi:hypothetical protein